jgi:hypothetical protein
MSKFILKELEGKTFKNSTRINYQIGLTDKKSLMTPEDVKYIVDGFAKKAPKGTKFVVHGLGVAGLHELGDSTRYKHRQMKRFYGDLKFLSEEEYLDGRAKETTKFLQYFQIMISIVKPNN